MKHFCVALTVLAGIGGPLPGLAGQTFAAQGGPRPNLESNIEHPLRYRPDGSDFVIENGPEFFNRPLYGGNTAFRVDAGDRPEFVLYLPGRGGNLRLGLRAPAGATWLFDAAHVVARYRPGEMLYEIRDPLLGSEGVLRLAVLALHQTEGLIVRVETEHGADGLELIWAYGGVNGERGRRDGDIGTEDVPISEWFQFQPEFCRDNSFAITGRGFALRSPVATIAGVTPANAKLAVVNAALWDDPARIAEAAAANDGGAPSARGAAAPSHPIIAGVVALRNGPQPQFLALQRTDENAAAAEDLATYREVGAPATSAKGDRSSSSAALLPVFRSDELPGIFAAAEEHFRQLRAQIAVDTPDPWLDAAVGALNVAADAVWDGPQGDIMHGAIAWRTRLLGWRGPYALDALGWHDRARRHFRYWASRQNTDPIPATLPPPDEDANLARSETALHSNGDMSHSHYDMNLVYIDALFRHLLWTGDRELARELWPTIERHLAWERRLFRRELGDERLPLYEAYAAIWASDDLEYEGGGVTYTSAYNFWHNTMAARVARWLGEDPAPFAAEADLIRRGMRRLLWLPEQGMFGEFKDWLGLQRVHPSAGLWSFYHVMDAPGIVTAREAWLMTRYVDENLPHLPVRGPGVPDDQAYQVLATTNWMPYTWSVNNVVMGENVHAALGYWRAGRGAEATRLMKAALLASMFMGICPGNVGSMNYLDVYRRESQRDFADGSGVLARAIVEGLFGIQPDGIAGELHIAPGFPEAWDHASIRTPDVSLAFHRDDSRSEYEIAWRHPGLKHVQLRVPAVGERLARAEINGDEVAASIQTDELQRRWLDLSWMPQARNHVIIEWAGEPVRETVGAIDAVAGHAPPSPSRAAAVAGVDAPSPASSRPAAAAATTARRFDPVPLAAYFNDRVTEIFRPGKYRSPRSPFVSLAIPAQGIGAWAGHVRARAEIDDRGLRRVSAENDGRLVLPNGVPLATPGPGDAPNILFTSLWDNYPDEATVPLQGHARRVVLLMAGSTNHMQSRFDNGIVVVRYADGSTAELVLRNPTNWWPIERDYFIDDYQFRRPGPIPPRVDLRTGEVRLLDPDTFKGRGRVVPGGAATVLELALDPARELESLTVQTLANEVVIGLMAATLER